MQFIWANVNAQFSAAMLESLVAADEQEEAAAKLQAMRRGKQARQELEAKHAAALKLQARRSAASPRRPISSSSGCTPSPSAVTARHA